LFEQEAADARNPIEKKKTFNVRIAFRYPPSAGRASVPTLETAISKYRTFRERLTG